MSATQLPISQALVLAGLELEERMTMVYSRDYGYNVLSQLATMMAPSISKTNPKFYVPSIGNLNIYETITGAPSLSGSDIVVTVASGGTNFRVGDVVGDAKTLIQGRVKSSTATTVTLAPLSTAFNASVHFLSGSNIFVMFDASQNRKSGGKETINYVPEEDFGYLSVTRESGEQARRDRTGSDVYWKGNFWSTSWIDTAMTRFSKSMEWKYAMSERGLYNAGTSTEFHTTGGLRDSIINRGGYYATMTSELTLSDLNDHLASIRTSTAASPGTLIALVGMEMLGRLQVLIGDKYLVNTGAQNTFGGVSVSGLKIMTYAYLDLELQFVHWPLLDDPAFGGVASSITGRSKNSYSMYIINTAPVPALDGSGSIAPLQRYHFNNDELVAGFVPGMTGLHDASPSAVKEAIANGIQGSMAASDIDSTSFHVLSDSGIYVVADRCGLLELAS